MWRSTGMSFVWVILSFLWFTQSTWKHWCWEISWAGCNIVILDMPSMSIYTDDLDLGRYDWDCASARRDLWVYDMALPLHRVGEHLSIHILLIFFEPKIWRNPPQRCPRRISALLWLLCHWTWTRKPPRGAGEVRITLIFAQKTSFDYFRSSLMHKHAALPPKLPLRQTCSFKSFF